MKKSQFSRSAIVREGKDMAYLLLWQAVHDDTIIDMAVRRGFLGEDIKRIQRQVEKEALRLKHQAHTFPGRSILH